MLRLRVAADNVTRFARLLSVAPLLLGLSRPQARGIVREDTSRWTEIAREQDWPTAPWLLGDSLRILFFLAYQRPFRSLYYYRLRQAGGLSKLSVPVLQTLYAPEQTLRLHAAQIGRGMYIAHGFATIIAWGTRIGDDCWLHQNVTIGQKSGGAPLIGNRVTIYPGAIIIGDISIGDDAVIGAQAVVVADVPPRSVARGVPARNYPEVQRPPNPK